MSKTGKRFNQNKLRWRNVPLWMFEGVIRVGQMGEDKYGTYNFLKGLPVLDTLDSLKRHLKDLESPFKSDYDEESGENHAWHVAWNAIVLGFILEHRKDLDDRFKLEDFNFEESKEDIVLESKHKFNVGDLLVPVGVKDKNSIVEVEALYFDLEGNSVTIARDSANNLIGINEDLYEEYRSSVNLGTV